jgi:Flp pilus assembly protein TadB
MAEENREIRTQAGTFRLTEEAAAEQAPNPEILERARRDMEHSQAAAEGEAKIRAERETREREARFAESLERHVEDRRQFHALRGVPEVVFETELRPEIERKFVAGEEDTVDRERRKRSTSIY